jgi:hypothetical protein
LAEVVGEQGEELRRGVVDRRKHHPDAVGARHDALERLANLEHVQAITYATQIKERVRAGQSHYMLQLDVQICNRSIA